MNTDCICMSNFLVVIYIAKLMKFIFPKQASDVLNVDIK